MYICTTQLFGKLDVTMKAFPAVMSTMARHLTLQLHLTTGSQNTDVTTLLMREVGTVKTNLTLLGIGTGSPLLLFVRWRLLAYGDFQQCPSFCCHFDRLRRVRKRVNLTPAPIGSEKSTIGAEEHSSYFSTWGFIRTAYLSSPAVSSSLENKILDYVAPSAWWVSKSRLAQFSFNERLKKGGKEGKQCKIRNFLFRKCTPD